jgi:hypothetical protein
MMKNCTAAPVREAGSSPSKLKAKVLESVSNMGSVLGVSGLLEVLSIS